LVMPIGKDKPEIKIKWVLWHKRHKT
jgi:hypothetical protein